jgi:hypothetical protein
MMLWADARAKGGSSMKRNILTAIALTVAVTIFGSGIAVGANALTARPVAVSWTQRTCAAFQTYITHRTTANLDALAADSIHAPWRYVGEDAWDLYGDVSSNSKYVSKDITYFKEDC